MQVSAGNRFSTALTAGGQDWAWGQNDRSQLGFGGDSSSVPVHVADLPGDVVQMSAGSDNVLARIGDGTVWGWGRNTQGTFGIGEPSGILLPQLVFEPVAGEGVEHVAATGPTSFITLHDGSALAAGYNVHGQLGVGSDQSPFTSWTPVAFGPECPPGSTPLQGTDPQLCSLVADTDYTYRLTTRVDTWSTVSDPLVVRTPPLT